MAKHIDGSLTMPGRPVILYSFWQRDATHKRCIYSRRPYLSVLPSVTIQYCIKTA